MRRKVLELNSHGVHLVVINDDTRKVNKFVVYKVWYDGRMHRKQLERYGDMNSCLIFFHEYFAERVGNGE